MSMTLISGSTSTIHTTDEPVSLFNGGSKVKAACGRTVTVKATWQLSDWSKMVARHLKLSKTHVVHTCGKCVQKSLDNGTVAA